MSNSSNKKNISKKKYIPISEIDRALIPGRREKCDCEASIHDLISNCLNCGRIVCESENVGPCFTCGQNVISKKELDELARINKEIADLEAKEKENDKIKQKKQQQQASKTLKDIAQSLIGIEKATEHKDKLLEYERTSEKRTKVIDDENDYFDLTRENWLSNEKREELKDKVDKLHEDRFDIDRRYELDFATRQVVEVQIPKIKDLIEEVNQLKKETEFKSDYEIVDFKDMANEPDLIPYYVDNSSNKLENNKNKNKFNKNQKTKPSLNKSSTLLPNVNLIRNRLQNSELFDLTDDGYALSINQPYASLLIAGIKQHEGRTWFTSHRGPLWIHASAKSPRKEEIQEAESLFKLILNDSDVKFPSNYPLGCLIGRAYLTECLAQEEYQNRFKNTGLIEDPFVFIFNDFIKLNVNVPCSGKQKIFKLDKNIFKVASSQIQKTYSRK